MSKGVNWQVVEFMDWFNENHKYQIMFNSYLVNFHVGVYSGQEYCDNVRKLLETAESDWETQRFESREKGNPDE